MKGSDKTESLKPSPQPAKTIQGKTIPPPKNNALKTAPVYNNANKTTPPIRPMNTGAKSIPPMKSVGNPPPKINITKPSTPSIGVKPDRKSSKAKDGITNVGEGLHHHFMSGKDFVTTHKTKAPEKNDVFQERYVDVVDTDDLHIENDPRTLAYNKLMVHLERLQYVYIFYTVIVAAMCALASYSFIQMERTYAFHSLHTIFLQTPTNIGIVITVVLMIPFFGLTIISYPNPKFKCYLYCRWIVFLFLEVYLFFCLVYYLLQLTEVDDIIKKGMLHDIQLPPVDDRGNLVKHPITIREYSHKYFQCCGYNDYKDWTPNLTSNSLDLGGYPIGCCNEFALQETGENPCFSPLFHDVVDGFKDNRKVIINEKGCGKHEVRMTYTISIFFATLIGLIIISVVPATVYLFYIIREANKYNFNLVQS